MPTRIVCMQVEKASLLIDNESEYVDIGNGIVLFVVFFKGAEEDNLGKIARKVLSTRIHIVPGTVDKEGFKKSTEDGFVRRSVLIVPQATMAGSVKKGNNPQYHGQVNKEVGSDLYAKLCDEFKAALKELDSDEDAGQVQVGTYGNRQALKFESAGPNTHIFEF